MNRIIYISILLFSLSFYGQNDTIVNNENVSNVFIKTRKVIYRGIKNEIFINVPNIETLTASSPGLTIENGRFFIIPTKGVEQKLFLRFKNNDGVFINEEHIFKIKQIDSVFGVINNLNSCFPCIIQLKKKDLLGAKISIKIPNHPFIDELEVGGFNITYNSKKNKRITLKNEGNILSFDNYQILSKLKIGSRFMIHSIYNKSRCDVCSEFINLIQIEIIE
jgi:hypothetical protein